MAYIGAKPVNGFFEKQQLSTDGSTTTFSLNFTVGSTTAILVVLVVLFKNQTLHIIYQVVVLQLFSQKHLQEQRIHMFTS